MSSFNIILAYIKRRYAWLETENDFLRSLLLSGFGMISSNCFSLLSFSYVYGFLSSLAFRSSFGIALHVFILLYG